MKQSFVSAVLMASVIAAAAAAGPARASVIVQVDGHTGAQPAAAGSQQRSHDDIVPREASAQSSLVPPFIGAEVQPISAAGRQLLADAGPLASGPAATPSVQTGDRQAATGAFQAGGEGTARASGSTSDGSSQPASLLLLLASLGAIGFIAQRRSRQD